MIEFAIFDCRSLISEIENRKSKNLESVRCELRGISQTMSSSAHVAGSSLIHYTSGYRCPEYNKAVGGKSDSSHLKGLAADIRAQTSSERFAIVNGLVKAGFVRIGMGRDFIHVDMDMSKPQHLMWVY